jgi:hypothetical protein
LGNFDARRIEKVQYADQFPEIDVHFNNLYAKRIENVRYADQFPGADMGAKINAAISDLTTHGNGGGKVVVPAGNYVVNTQIVMSDNQHGIILEGAATTLTDNYGDVGPAGTLLIYQGSASPFISAQNDVGVDIRNLMIEIVSTSLAIDFAGSTYPTLEDATVVSMYGSPAVENATLVSLNNTVSVVIRHVQFKRGKIAILGATDSQHWANSVIIDASNFGVFASSPIQGVDEAWTIKGNVFEPLLAACRTGV